MIGLYSETSTSDGAPLYRAVDVSRELEDADISDRIGIAADIIEGTYQTGFEADLNYFAQRGFAGQAIAPAMLSPLSTSLRRKTMELAAGYQKEHRALMEDALGEAVRLQEAFPKLLYAIGQNRARTFKFGEPVKVTGFEESRGILRPIYEVEQHSFPWLALCDVRALHPNLQQGLDKRIR